MLLTNWFDDPLRPTQDLDFLGFGDDDPDEMVKTFREICAVSFDDGVVFDVEGVQIDRIRKEREYGGLRIKTIATVDGARVRVVIDIGFGDAVEPGLAERDLPVMLNSRLFSTCFSWDRTGDAFSGRIDGLNGSTKRLGRSCRAGIVR